MRLHYDIRYYAFFSCRYTYYTFDALMPQWYIWLYAAIRHADVSISRRERHAA